MALAAGMSAVMLAACSTGTVARPAASAPGSSAAATPRASVTIAELPAGPPPTALAGYYAQTLRWQVCGKGFQCARLLVPFDYRRPAWRRFSLPVIRLRATDPAKRIGSLVVNPGGPGGSGISYARQARAEIAARPGPLRRGRIRPPRSWRKRARRALPVRPPAGHLFLH